MKYLFLLLSLFMVLGLSAQQKARIKLVRADKLKPAVFQGRDAQKLSGKVVFKHAKTIMHCDSAYFYDGDSEFDAFGNIYINDNDSIRIYGNDLHYSGTTKLAELYGDVVMKDNKMTLTTDHLHYNIKTKRAHYYEGGTIVDEENTLTSDVGYYYSNTKTFYYQSNVVLTNPKYKMYSDTLIYNTDTETSYFHGPTQIISKENSIFCQKGWYNTKTNLSRYYNNATLKSETQELFSDSLYYDRNRGYGQAFRNVEIIDTVKNIILRGHYAEYYEQEGNSLITDNCLAIIIDENSDSLYLHSDTMRLELDSNQQAKNFIAYNKTLFYKKDVQGKCDSLIYRLQDSILYMYESPLIWGSESQISGMKIRMTMSQGKIDKAFIDTNAFILQRDTLEYYNQVSGKNMVAYFENDALEHVDVLGNAETVYFVREEDGTLVGVNLANASDLKVEFSNGEVSNLIYLSKPKASLNPIEKVSKRALYLRNFKSYEHWRPKTKEDIFIWEPENKSSL